MNFVDTSLFKFINDQLTMEQSWSELSLFGFYHLKLSESMLNINRFCCCCLIWRNFLNTEASVKQKPATQTVQFWWLHLDCLNFTNNSCHAWEEWVEESSSASSLIRLQTTLFDSNLFQGVLIIFNFLPFRDNFYKLIHSIHHQLWKLVFRQLSVSSLCRFSLTFSDEQLRKSILISIKTLFFVVCLKIVWLLCKNLINN